MVQVVRLCFLIPVKYDELFLFILCNVYQWRSQ
jgi:hypothetical protein